MNIKIQLVLITTFLVIKSINCQICQIGCDICDNQNQCLQCLSNFEKDQKTGLCRYLLCDKDLYWQIKLPQIDFSQQACQSVCDEGYWMNKDLNICELIYPCSKSLLSQDSIDSQKTILKITQYAQNVALVHYQDKMNLISLYDGQLFKSIQFQYNTLFAFYMSGYFFLFNNDQTISVLSLKITQMLSSNEKTGIIDSFSKLLLLNNNFYLIAKSRQDINTLIIKKIFNIENSQFETENEFISIVFKEQEQIFIFDQNLIFTSDKGIKIIQIQEQEQKITLQNYTSDFLCEQLQSIQIQDLSSFNNGDSFFIISNNVKNLIKMSQQTCKSYQLDDYPKQLVLIQQGTDEKIFLSFTNKLLILDSNLLFAYELSSFQQTQLYQFNILQTSNSIFIVTLYSNNTLAFYQQSQTQGQDQQKIQLVKQQQISRSKYFMIFPISDNQNNYDSFLYKIFTYDQEIQAYYVNIQDQKLDFSFQKIINSFQRKYSKQTKQIASIKSNNNHLFSAISASGQIQTWDTSQYFNAKIIDSINFGEFGNASNIIYFTYSSLLVLFDTCVIRYNVITHQIENQWNFKLQDQLNKFIASQNQYAIMIFDSCLFIIDSNNNQIVQECSQNFEETILTLEFTKQYLIVIQKQKEVISYQLDDQLQPIQLTYLNTYNSNDLIWQTKIRSYKNRDQNKTFFDLLIFKQNYEFLILNELMEVILQVPNIYINLPIDIGFGEQGDEEEEFYFVLGRAFQNKTSYQNIVYAISKIQKSSQICVYNNGGNSIFKVLKYLNLSPNNTIYEIKLLNINNLFSQIVTFVWGAYSSNSVVGDILQLKGWQFTQVSLIKSSSYYFIGDQSGALAASLVKKNIIEPTYKISNEEQNLQDYITKVNQSLELGLFFVIKSNIVVYNLYTNEYIETIEVYKSPQSIEIFKISPQNLSIIALKKNCLQLRNYSDNQTYKFDSLQLIIGFIIHNDSIYVYGSDLLSLSLSLKINFQKKLSNINAQICRKAGGQILGCKMSNSEFRIYSLKNLQLISTITSEYLDSSYRFSIDDEYLQIYLFTSTVEVYTQDGYLVQKITQSNGLIYEIQFFKEFLVYRNLGYLKVCNRRNFQNIGQVFSTGGGNILKFFLIEEYNHLVFFTSNIRFQQIISYDISNFEVAIEYKCEYAQNDCTVLVDALFDKDLNSILLIDMFGNFQTFNYAGVYQPQVILKLQDFKLPKFNNLKGFSIDFRINSLLIYNSYTVYRIPYGDLNDYIKQIEEQKQYIFSDVSDDNQELKYNTYIILGDQGQLYWQQQAQYNYYCSFDEEAIQIQYNKQQQILAIAFQDKIIVLFNVNQTTVLNSQVQLTQKKEIQLSGYFSRFLSEDIFLTSDSVVWHYDFSNQTILYKFSFRQTSVTISSEFVATNSNLLLLGMSNGDFIVYNFVLKKEQIFRLSQIDQNSEILSPISFIKDTQDYFYICYSKEYGVYRINKLTSIIEQILRFSDIKTYQIIEDTNVSIFEVDEQFSRIFINFLSESIVRIYQYDSYPSMSLQYLMLTKRQENKIFLGDKIIIFYSSAFLLIYDRQTLKYLSNIRRINNLYYITDIKLIQDKYLLIISQQRVEFFIFQTIQNPKLIDQIITSNPIVINFQLENSKYQINTFSNDNILYLVILGEYQIYEKRYSLDYEESNDDKRYCFASIQVQSQLQFLKELNQIKPQTYPSLTQIDVITNPNSSFYNYLMVTYQYSELGHIDRSNTKDSSIVIYSRPVSTNQKSNINLMISNNTLLNYEKPDIYLRDYKINFQQTIVSMPVSDLTDNIYYQNLFIEDQDVTNVKLYFYNLKKVVFKRLTYYNLQMKEQKEENSENQSFNNFKNVEELSMYDILIDNNFTDKMPFKSYFTATNITTLRLKNITIKNQLIEDFIVLSLVKELFIENINIINCQFMQKSQKNYIGTIFSITGIYTTYFENIKMTDCQDLSLVISTNIQLDDQQIVKFKSDGISFSNLDLSQNKFQNQSSSSLICIQNSIVSITGLQYSYNQGNIQIKDCIEANLKSSQLINNINENGGALSIYNCSSKISIANSNFTSNKAFANGGAILIQEFYGDLDIQVSSTKIINNTALIGGGLRIINENYNQFNLNYWNQIKQVFINNTAEIYGNNFTTFLQDIGLSLPNDQNISGEEQQELSLLNSYRTKDNLTNLENELWYGIAEINNFRSGSNFIVYLSLIDFEGREFTYYPSKVSQNIYPNSIIQEITQIKFKLENISPSSYISITGQDIITYQQFSEQNNKFIFKQVQITSLPKSQQHIQISFILNQNSYVKSKPILVNLNLRQCQRGEILKQISKNIYSCYQCPLGFYSLVNPQLPNSSSDQSLSKDKISQSSSQEEQCNNCPSEAQYCKGDQISLKNGFWRKNELSTEIIQCNTVYNVCQGQNPESKNYCGFGHTGPVCRECDYSGKIWDGKIFTKSLQNELKCSQCLFLSLQVALTLLTFLAFLIYIQIQMIIFMNNFMHHQTCYYLRAMKIIPILNNSIKDQSSFYLKILINFTQISSILVAYQNSMFPDIFAVVPSFIGSPTNSFMISMSCIVSQLAKTEIGRIQTLQMLQAIMPLAYLIFCLSITNILRVFKKFNVKKYHKYTLVNLLFVLFQPNQVSFFSNQLACTKVGSKYYVSSNMLIDCGEPSYRNFAYILSIPLLLFWSFLPLLIFFKLKRRSKKLDYCVTRYTFGYYYTEFKIEFYYWEIIRIYIRVVIVVLSTLLKEYSFINQQICVFVIYIYIKYAMHYSPIVNKNLQKFDNFCYQVIIFNTLLSTVNSSLNSQILLSIIWSIHFLFVTKIIFQIIFFKLKNPQNFFRKYFVSLLLKLNFSTLSQNLQNRQNKEKKSLKYWKSIFKNLQVLIKKQAFEQINQNSLVHSSLHQSQSQSIFMNSFINFQVNSIDQKPNSTFNQQNISIFSLQNDNNLRQNVDFQMISSQNDNITLQNNQSQSIELQKLSIKQDDQKENKILLQKDQTEKSQESIYGLQDLDNNAVSQNFVFSQNYETKFKHLSQKLNQKNSAQKD